MSTSAVGDISAASGADIDVAAALQSSAVIAPEIGVDSYFLLGSYDDMAEEDERQITRYCSEEAGEKRGKERRASSADSGIVSLW